MKIFNGNTEILDITVNDESYRYRAIRGEHNLTLYFSLAAHVEIPVGAHCVYQNETFTLYSPANLKMLHSRNFEYTVVFEAAQAEAKMLKFRNPVDGRLKFSLTATPAEFLEIFIGNMNRNTSGWTMSDCIQATPKTISFNHTSCADALSQIADEFKTEFEFSGKTVSLKKVEYNRKNPLELAYGKGHGFKPGIGRSNYSRQNPIGVLYVQGGSKNIDSRKNGGSSELLLPKSQTIRFDGTLFEDEPGFDTSNARTYVTDEKGMTIRRAENERKYIAEDSLDCTEIYPSRVGTVSDTRFLDNRTGQYYTEAQEWSDEDWSHILIDIIDRDIPESLDYGKYHMDVEKMSVVFQDGMLAGKEFDVIYFHEAKDGKPARRFELVQQEIDGLKMPGGKFIPKKGQKFVVLGCSVPDAYICDNESRSGASWEMFRKGIRYLYDNEEQKFTFTGQLDGIWAKKDWLNIEGKIKLGGYIQFTDERFQEEGVLIRITGIKDFVNNPHSPEIELSNSTVGHSLAGALQKIDSNEVAMEEGYKAVRQFTKRRFRDSEESISMLKDALANGFSDSVSPLTVQTMMALVGDKSLQFRFVDSMSNPNAVSHDIHYDNDRKILVCEEGIIQHLTLDVKSISPSHEDSEYHFWQLPEFESPVLVETDKKYYLYAKVKKDGNSGKFHLSEKAIPMEPAAAIENVEDWADCYFFLVGMLGSENNGERSFSSWYGFTEIAPGQVTTDIIRDADGKLVIDLSQATIIAKDGARIEGNLSIGSGSSGLDNLTEWTEKQEQIDNTVVSANDEYYISTSETEPTGGEWSENMPEWEYGYYIWRRTKLTKTNGDIAYTVPPINVTKEMQDFDKGVYGNDDVLTIAEKREIRRMMESIIITAPEHEIPTCEIKKVVDKPYVSAVPKINVRTSEGSWKKVTAGMTNNGISMDDYIGWFASKAISSSETTMNTLYIYNNSDIAVEVVIEFQSDGESNYDYLMVGVLDQTGIPTAGTTSSYDFDTKGRQKQVISKTYTVPKGTHSLKMVYRKDGNINTGTDSAYFRFTSVPIDQVAVPEVPATYKFSVDFGNLTGGSLYFTLKRLIDKEYNEADESMAINMMSIAKTLARDSIYRANLWENVTTPNAQFVRNVYRHSFNNYSMNEVQISDFEYLQRVFGKSLDVEGAVLSKLVGVKDKFGDVVAGLNGSDMGKDNDHGKMLFFGGTARATDAELKNADTKIYEDGTIDTSKLIAKNGCKIGDWTIGGDRTPGALYIARKANQDNLIFDEKETLLTNDLARFVLNNYPDRNNPTKLAYSKTVLIGTSITGYLYDTLVYAKYNDNRDSITGIKQRIGVYSSVKGPLDPNLPNDGSNGNFAFYAENGMFAGLRPMTRVIKYSTKLTKLDHTIIIDSAWNAAELTITLPDDAEIGQCYDIYGNHSKGDSTYYFGVVSNTNNISCPYNEAWNLSKIRILKRESIRIIRVTSTSWRIFYIHTNY